MAYNPFQAFEVGQKVGKARRSTFGQTSDTLMENFQEDRKINKSVMPALIGAQFKENLERSRPLDAKQQSEVALNEEKIKQYKSGKMVGRLSPEEMANRKTEVLKATGAGAQATPINAAFQSLKSARNSKNILFPDGTAKSFRADIATMKHPLLGRPTLSKDAQDLAREYGIALDLYNRQVTGAAFSETEFNHRMNQFKLDLLSNPESAFNTLTRLEELNTDYLRIADPQGIFTGSKPDMQNRADTAPDASTTSNVIDKEKEKQTVREKLASGKYDKQKLLAIYRRRTGEDYAG